MTNYQWWNGFPDARYGYGAMYAGFMNAVPSTIKMHERASVRVEMQVPFAVKGYLEGQHKALFTMWETDVLPDRFERWVPHYDQIIVPCQHNVELFSRYHDNVSMVPLGVDQKIWYPVDREPNKRFRFHAGGSLWRRKGMDLVIQAFVKSGVDADLYLKVPPQAKDTPENIRLPANVHLERRFLPFHEVFEWYGLADCFIAPSRGEGFGLMPLQAMAMGVPTIITATSGQAEYAHIATTVVPHVSKRSDFVGNWDEADMDSLVQAIRDHYANRDKYEIQALANVPKVKEFSWAKAAKKLVSVLPEGEVLDGATQFKPFACMMRIVTNRNIESSINMVTYKFQKGVEYVVKEGVFEVLSNAGYIDSYKVEPL